MNAEVIGLIVIPVAIFLVGGALAAIRGAIRFAQYMVRTEESQAATAQSVKEVAERLSNYATSTTEELHDHSERLVVIEYAMQNRKPSARPAPGRSS